MKKLLIYLKWFVIAIPMGIFGIITAPIIYPLWDLTHWKIFWWWGNSSKYKEDGSYKEDYKVYIYNHGGKETFWVRYLWHGWRNRIWNMHTLYKKEGDGTGNTELEIIIDDLILNGKKVQDGGKWPMVCGLKYKVIEGQDPWQGWVGDEIDFKYSILGKSLIWFKDDGILSFRYSQCKVVRYWLFWKRWRTIKIAIYKDTHTFSWKYQRLTD